MGEAAEFADAGAAGDEDETDEATAPAEPEGLADAAAPAASGSDSNELPETRGTFGPKKAGEFERRRGWRCDQGTLERFKALIKEFVGTQ